MSAKPAQIEKCLRCGSCCDKGGPAFHVQDRHLIENKILPVKHIYTIRKGEPARDNIRETLIFVKSDIIKIKGREGSWQCFFTDSENKLCEIYKDRPFECRILKCWDTEEIERLHDKDYLTRKDLFFAADSLWELIEEHQRECSYEKIRDLLKAPEQKLSASYEEILKMIEYDANIRSVVIEKMRGGFDLSELIFGRPLLQTIRGFGLELVKDESGYILSPRDSKK